MAYDQQIQKQETEKSNIVNPKIKLTEGRLELLRKPDPFFSDYTIASGDEYEPAPGKVSRHPHFHNGICWTHGNFVARKKRSGCFSFLPAPRTLFFFELAYRNGFNGVVTCTALDELVTEAYSVLGFPLWWSARRTDMLLSACLRVDITMWGKSEMCYRRSHVLHPYPGEFAFGYHDPYHPYSAEC
ncbi:uncharacterized protein [Miscanthus floridulus]|uniref:uncharacterized protein n=1 Tax=Miscanthus floridulus TaxID=154761 RepID=UPI003459F145